jgi:hypothetical protein
MQKDLAPDEVSVAKQFVGMWRLVTCEHRLVDGTIRHDPKSMAYFIYTDTNHVCYVAMNPGRAAWKSATAPTADEMAAGLGNHAFYAYCAKAELHVKRGFILLHLEIDKSPNMVGATRKRWFTFEGTNRVVLRVDPQENTLPVVESTLTWERVHN